MSCLMEVDPHGTVVDHEICESVIRSDRRMTYTAVNAILSEADTKEKEEQKAGLLEEYKDFVAMFERMKELSAILGRSAVNRGPSTLIFRKVRSFWMRRGNRWISILMNGM